MIFVRVECADVVRCVCCLARYLRVTNLPSAASVNAASSNSDLPVFGGNLGMLRDQPFSRALSSSFFLILFLLFFG